MDMQKKESLKERLLEMQAEIIQNIIGETSDEENPFNIDGDLVDRADALNAVALSEGLTATQKKTLEKIQMALHSMKDGSYGKCVNCKKDIEEDRLDAIPYANTCKEHMNSRR